jgi:vacuolar-type H+-ATPase subunit I/STV1
MAMATTGQVVPFTAGGPAEIDTYIDMIGKVYFAMKDLDDEWAKIDPDLAKQITADSAGKPKLDADAVLTKYKAMLVKKDQLEEKRKAMEAALESVTARLEELKKSSPSEYIQVLDKRIAEQRKISTKTQDETSRAQEALKALIDERDQVAATHTAANPPPSTSTAEGAEQKAVE